MAVERFDKREREYLAWVETHQSGFVINSLRSLNPASFVLHHASCWSISTDKWTNYTTNDYIKVCADTRSEIDSWARTNGGHPSPCGLCHP